MKSIKTIAVIKISWRDKMKRKFCMLSIFMLLPSFAFGNILIQPYNPTEEKFTILYDGYHSVYGASGFDTFNSRLPAQFIIEYTDEILTAERLSSYNILVISHPIEEYSTEEIYNIKKFVEEGGGLLVMGTGWAYVDYLKKPIEDYPLNQIAREFGVTMNDDLITDPTDYHTVGEVDYPVFTNFAVHPVTEGLKKVYAGWPSSFSIIEEAVPIVAGDEDTYSADYHKPVYKAGELPPVAVALEYRRGKVVFLGNGGFLSGCLDDFDNLKFGLNIIDWFSEPSVTALGEYAFVIFYVVLAASIVILTVFSLSILKKSIKRREIPEVPHTARNAQDVMILSFERRTETEYQISLESVHGAIYSVKSPQPVDIAPEVRSEIIARIDCASRVINTFLSFRKKPKKTAEELKKMGTVIYKNFIPRNIAQELVHRYLVLEVEDVQIPWELMYSDQFLMLKYAISRRIKSEKVLTVPQVKKREKKALIIADPTETVPGAIAECEYLEEHLQPYFTVTYLPPEKARKVDIMYHFSQEYDIIHYAGELETNTCIPMYKGALTCAEIEKNLEGSPIVFLNGCCSAKTFSYDIEGLAKVFLERGALSFIGSLWGIHDKKAAEIAVEFYKNCVYFPVGEALRLSRRKYYSSEDITWAAFIMYGDPTLNLYGSAFAASPSFSISSSVSK